MREYARTEIIREKCHFCGCKNKLFTELIKADHTEIGMVLRCCNCGKLTFHINPGLGIDVVENYINHKIYAGKSKCIQESYCPHTPIVHYMELVEGIENLQKNDDIFQIKINF